MKKALFFLLFFFTVNYCLANQIPDWLSNFPNSDSTYYTLGIAFTDFGEDYYKEQAENMAAVIISRLIKTFVIRRYGEAAVEEDFKYQYEYAQYHFCVTGVPERLDSIKSQLGLIDNFFIDSNFIGLYSYPGESNFNEIQKGSERFLSTETPEWFEVKDDYLEINSENYVVQGFAESPNLGESIFHALEDAQYRLAEYKDINSESVTIDITSEGFSMYQKFTFMETSFVFEKIKIKRVGFSKREKDDKWLYGSYIELEVPK